MSVRVQHEDFDVGAELALLHQDQHEAGAVASFLGLVRAHNDGETVSGLALEHYPGMTEKSLQAIEQEARSRWPLLDVLIIHRVGELALGERIVLVGVSSAHRGAAFEACAFIMDYLKTRAPFWKREGTASGSRWVDARDSDTQAAERWEHAGHAAGPNE